MASATDADAKLEDTQYLDEDFKEWLQGLLLKYHVPGMSIAVVTGETVQSAGYGLARLPDVPATFDTLFSMGSTTKAFTAALLGLHIHSNDRDKPTSGNHTLKWSTPIADVLADDFVTTDPYITTHISIEDALSHRSGIPGHDLFWGPSLTSAADLTRTLRHLGPITAPFRGKFQYNNLMYAICGHVLETIEQKPFPEILKTRLLEPLDMKHTFSGVNAASRALEHDSNLSFARGYYWVAHDSVQPEQDSDNSHPPQAKTNSGHYITEPYLDLAAIGPAGNNISSVKDYAKWVQAFLSASKKPAKSPTVTTETSQATTTTTTIPISTQQSSKQQIITHDLYLSLTTPRSINQPTLSIFPDIISLPDSAHLSPALYALGWSSNPIIAPGEIVFEHGGGMPGFGAGVFILPNRQFGVVAAGNTSMTSNKVCEAVAREVVGRMLGKSKDERRRFDDGAEERAKKEMEAEVEEEHVAAGGTGDTINAEQSGIQGEELSRKVDLSGTYKHPAYKTMLISQPDPNCALSSAAPALEGCRIERKDGPKPTQQNTAKSSTRLQPFLVTPVPKRGLDYKLLLHNARLAANDRNVVVYDQEFLLRHGNLEADPFWNLQQDFPSQRSEPGDKEDGDKRYVLKDEVIWQSQKIDKKGAVVLLDEEGKVESLGLQMMRVDVPEKQKQKGKLGDVELEDGWRDRLIWFEKAEG